MAHSINRPRLLHRFPWWKAQLRYGRVVLLCGLLIFASAAGGCRRGSGWSLIPVEGTATKNGRPLQGVEVVFLAETEADTMGPPRSAGRTDAAGHYRLRNDNGDDGVVAGKYRVLILDSHPLEGLSAVARERQL